MLIPPWVYLSQFTGMLGWGQTYLMWLHHGWASNPTWSASQIHNIYIKCLSTLISCEWVYGTTLSLIPPLTTESRVNFQEFLSGGPDLSGVVTSWLSLKPHLECFTNPYRIYKKCFCTLMSCEWVYGPTISLILPPLSLGSMMWLHHGWASNPLRLLPTSISYEYKYFSTSLISCEWVYGTSFTSLILPLSLSSLVGSIFRNFGVGADLSDVVTSWLSLKPHLECFTNPYHIYKVFPHLDKLWMGVWHNP